MIVATLLYHDILAPGEPADSSGLAGPGAAVYKLDDARFEAHLDAIARARPGQAPVTAPELHTHLAPATLPWMLTFDDGGASALRIAERLARRGWTGHFFITAERIGDASFVDAAGIRELAAGGHIVGSHSWSHPARMSALAPTAMREEWARSIGALQDILGVAVTTASVPGGFYSRTLARSAAACGVRVLFNSEPEMRAREVDDCLIVGRFSVLHGTSAHRAAAFVAGRRSARWPAWLGWNTRKLVKRAVGRGYERGREALLRRRQDPGGRSDARGAS